MDFFSINNLNGYMKTFEMKTIWKQKVSNNDFKSGIPGDTTNLNNTNNNAGFPSTDSKLTTIMMKMQSGDDLSPSELEYLRENSIGAYNTAIKLRREREEYEKALKNCKTKDEARMLQMGKVSEALTQASQAIANNDLAACLAAGARMTALSKVYGEFTKSAEYREMANNYVELAGLCDVAGEEIKDIDTDKTEESAEGNEVEQKTDEENTTLESGSDSVETDTGAEIKNEASSSNVSQDKAADIPDIPNIDNNPAPEVKFSGTVEIHLDIEANSK